MQVNNLEREAGITKWIFYESNRPQRNHGEKGKERLKISSTKRMREASIKCRAELEGLVISY